MGRGQEVCNGSQSEQGDLPGKVTVLSKTWVKGGASAIVTDTEHCRPRVPGGGHCHQALGMLRRQGAGAK